MASITHANRIIALLRDGADLDDDEIAARLGIRRQLVNQECRRLAIQGLLVRGVGGIRGKIINTLSVDAGPRSAPNILTRPTQLWPATQYTAPEPPSGARAEILVLETHSFQRVCEITPKRTPEGLFQALLPQERYNNTSAVGLNRYGAGPFCKFAIPAKYTDAGVYIISVNRVPMYVGECENLANRYNMGYGNISPRNCFLGGQETNCRINNLIYQSVSGDAAVELWFVAMPEFKNVERQLRASLRLPWNRI